MHICLTRVRDCSASSHLLNKLKVSFEFQCSLSSSPASRSGANPGAWLYILARKEISLFSRQCAQLPPRGSSLSPTTSIPTGPRQGPLIHSHRDLFTKPPIRAECGTLNSKIWACSPSRLSFSFPGGSHRTIEKPTLRSSHAEVKENMALLQNHSWRALTVITVHRLGRLKRGVSLT